MQENTCKCSPAIVSILRTSPEPRPEESWQQNEVQQWWSSFFNTSPRVIMMIIMIIMTCNNDDHHSLIPPHVPGSWNARSALCWILRYSSYNAVPWRGDLWYDSSHSILVPPLAWKFQEGSSLQFPRSSLPVFPLSAVVCLSSET